MVDRQKIEELYKSYGYEIHKESENIGVYVYKRSKYFGADVFPFGETEEIISEANNVKDTFANLGYAASVKQIKSIEEAEVELFKSFFNYASTKQRLVKKYQEFEKKQTRNLLGNKYEYINTPYETQDNKFNDETENLINVMGNFLTENNPHLIIIEAAAGYGKTCAAYELLNHITNSQLLRAPIFTELSRNRGAKIFRYILLDEIDIEYPTLNSELVVQQIKNGRIPLIIDGFDELLDKVNLDKDVSESFGEIETMLDTIGNLLDGKAKIILTTRKTAIFSGLEFDKWLEKWANKFKTTRFSIKEPRIKDWLGTEKFQTIKEHQTPIKNIANPVILTFLKNLSIIEFNERIQHPEMLVQHYFDKMLEREKERQQLIITVKDQYEIFKNVVRLLLELDITTESKEFFKEIIRDKNSGLLEYTRTLYSGNNRPTLENLLDTLATHALLDRKGRNENQIGFINDFVLGTFIGEIICETPTDKIQKEYSYFMIELAATAYKIQSKDKKELLWEKIINVQNKFNLLSIFNFDISLTGELKRNYLGITIYDIQFFNVNFHSFLISSTVFLNCNFKNCQFDTEIFEGVSFVNCVFDTCSVTGNRYLDSSEEISTIKCQHKSCDILKFDVHYENNKTDLFDETENLVLKHLLKISNTKSHHIMQLLHCFEKREKKKVLKSLISLENNGYVQIRGNHIWIDMNKLSLIKQFMGLP